MFNNAAVKDIMKTSVISVEKSATLKQIREIFAKHKIHHLPILDHERIVGIVSSNDVHVAEIIGTKIGETLFNIEQITASEFMQKEVVSILSDATIIEALKFFLEHKIHALPVIDKNNKIVGIITTYDVISFLLKNLSYMK